MTEEPVRSNRPFPFRFSDAGVDFADMDFDEISQSLKTLWEQKPGAVVLLVLGFFVFVFLVVDTWRHKRRRRRPR